jgi:uncharacterized protein YkwD
MDSTHYRRFTPSIKNTFGRKAIRLATAAILLLSSLALLTANAPIPEPTLAPPPELITDSQPEAALDVQAATAVCSSRRCVFLPVIQRGQTDLDPRNRSDAVALYSKEYLGANAVNSGWNGSVANCVAGSTLNAFKDRVLSRVNYYRVMSGLSKVQMDSAYNQTNQKATLIMSANGTLNHSPSSSSKCYSADGAAAAGTSNLAMGVYGPGAIDLYMSDGGVSSLGHRRWVLFPQTQAMGTGDIPGEGSSWQTITNALKVIDGNAGKPRPATRDAFVAWPPPTYIPYAIVPTIWSFSIAGADLSGTTISMTVAGNTTAYSASALPNGYGENTVAWTVSGSNANPGGDKAYQVSIKNVKVGGQTKNYTYTVTVIDPNR